MAIMLLLLSMSCSILLKCPHADKGLIENRHYQGITNHPYTFLQFQNFLFCLAYAEGLTPTVTPQDRSTLLCQLVTPEAEVTQGPLHSGIFNSLNRIRDGKFPSST